MSRRAKNGQFQFYAPAGGRRTVVPPPSLHLWFQMRIIYRVFRKMVFFPNPLQPISRLHIAAKDFKLFYCSIPIIIIHNYQQIYACLHVIVNYSIAGKSFKRNKKHSVLSSPPPLAPHLPSLFPSIVYATADPALRPFQPLQTCFIFFFLFLTFQFQDISATFFL